VCVYASCARLVRDLYIRVHDCADDDGMLGQHNIAWSTTDNDQTSSLHQGQVHPDASEAMQSTAMQPTALQHTPL
jgi:hypothetical protein